MSRIGNILRLEHSATLARWTFVAALAIAPATANLAWAQQEGEDPETEDAQLVPDYLTEDLFIDVEEDEEEPEEDFFDSLEISTDEIGEDEEDGLEGMDIGGIPTVPGAQEPDASDYASFWDTAVFRALDKVTARIQIIEVALEEVVTFERFEIRVRQCNKRPPEETPNTTAFVEILELGLGIEDQGSESVPADAQSKLVMEIGLEEEANRVRPENQIFAGWMFASSPGLNAVEHPVYDVWLIDCKRSAPVIIEPSVENEIVIEPGE